MKEAHSDPLGRWLTTRAGYMARLPCDAALISILIFAAYLRFNNLTSNPGWYSDEGSDLDIARNLMGGRLQYFAVSGTPLVAARTPLFHLALIGAIQLVGYDILAARLVAAVASFVTIVLLCLTAREMLGERGALLAAFVYTIMPNALLYNRMGFGYNMQAPFFVICWWALWRVSVRRDVKSLVISTLAAGFGYMTELTGLSLVLIVALVAWRYMPRHLIWSLALMFAPGLIYLGVLFAVAPLALQPDLALTFSRSSASLPDQVFNLVSNWGILFDWSPWIVIGAAGLFLLESRRVRLLSLLICFLTLFSIMRAFPGGVLNFHRYLELLPFLALGGAQFLLSAQRFLATRLIPDLGAIFSFRLPHSPILKGAQHVSSIALISFLLWIPLVWTSVDDLYLEASPISPSPTRLDYVLITNPVDAIYVSDFINSYTPSNDVVLASPGLAWRIQRPVADFQQALAFEGIPTNNYGAALPRSRFVFDASFEHATLVVVDNLWRGWASGAMPPLKGYLATIETWPLVLERGEFEVYRNPTR